MRNSLRMVSGVLSAACSCVVIACSAADPDAEIRADEVNASPPPAGGDAPAAPTSPIPPELQLDGGAPETSAPAPSDPTLRTMWAIDAMGRLVSFTNKDTTKTTTSPITGLAQGEKILGIDFRPADGKLYGIGSSSRLYVLDASGKATAVGAKSFTPALAGTAFGFDVNPVADKIRTHSDSDQNLRLDPAMGTAVVDGTLSFAAGDPNQGQSPNLVATAYTNSVKPAPTSTVLYAIDSTRNLLVKLATPNDGKVTTVGALGVDVTDVGGFDIWGKDAALEAYATLTVNETVGGKTTPKTSLYAIDLTKGTAKAISGIDHPVALSGLAIQP